VWRYLKMYKKTLKYRVSVGILGISISQKVVKLLECSKGHMKGNDHRHIKWNPNSFDGIGHLFKIAIEHTF